MSRAVTLTFDNGPTPDVTPAVLDCLARHDIKATFFVIGKRAAAHPELVHRTGAERHWIGNHTFSHAIPLGELDAAAAIDELDRAEEVLAPALEVLGDARQARRLFRPYGRAGRIGRHLLHPAVVARLLAGKFTCVLWNCIVGDWRDPDGWVDRAMAQCRSEDWNLIVLHDIPSGAMAHLDRFLKWLREEGIEIRQEFPPQCVPMVDGQVVLPMEGYVANAAV